MADTRESKQCHLAVQINLRGEGPSVAAVAKASRHPEYVCADAGARRAAGGINREKLMVSRVEASPRDGVAAIDSFRSNLDTGTLMALAIGLTLTMLVGGCAAPYDAKYPYEQGWRLGQC